jgi:hypothetical protein
MYEISAKMTNDEDFSFLFYVLDTDGEVPEDFGDYEFELAVRNTDTQSEVFVLTNGDGITPTEETGAVAVHLALADHDLDPNTRYSIGCRIVTAGLTKQLFTGTLTVLEGNFR